VGSVLAHAPGLVYIHEPFNLGYGRPFTRAPFTRQFQYVTPSNAHVYEPGLRETLDFHYDLAERLRAIRQGKGPAAKVVRDTLHAIETWAAFHVHRRSGRWRPLVKDPIALLSAEWLAERFDMQVVVMIRHPAGFVSSALRHPGILTRAEDFLDQPELMEGPLAPFRAELEASRRDGWPALERAVLQWRLLNRVVSGYRRRHPEWTYLRHEDLCADPEAGFLALADRLGVDFAAAARRVLERTSRPDDSAEVDRAWEVRRNSRAVSSLFRTRLSADQIATIRLRSADVADGLYGPHEW
jgi:hypothetical protein